MKTLNDIKKIAVLGAGVMGPGIAQIYAMGGYDVTMWTRSEATREKAKATLHNSLVTFAEEGMIPADQVEAIYGRVNFALTVPEAVAGAVLLAGILPLIAIPIAYSWWLWHTKQC